MGFSLDTIYNNVNWAINSHSQTIFRLQEQAATGQAINRPSDDPMTSNQILHMKGQHRSLEQYLHTLEESIATLSAADTAVQNISDSIGKAAATLTNGSSSSMAGTMADQINGYLDDIFMLVNEKDQLNKYIFGGAKSDTAPYVATRDAEGKITRVTYQGSMEERKVEVASDVEMSAVLVGENVLKTDDREAPEFMSADAITGVTTTGAVAGAGTSSVRGTVWLTVTAAGGNNYTLSIDGGTTTFTLDITTDPDRANYPVVSSTGEVLYVDTTAITQGGTELVKVSGTYDVFNVLISARDMLELQESSLPAGVWDQMINDLIGEVQTVEKNLTRAFPMVGGRIETFTTLQDSLEDMKYNTEQEISRMQDADITEVAVELARHEVLYEMSLQVASKLFTQSLMDYIS